MKTRAVAWVTCAAMLASCAFVYTIRHNHQLTAQAAAAPKPAASAIATTSASRERIAAAPAASGRGEVLHGKAAAVQQRE